MGRKSVSLGRNIAVTACSMYSVSLDKISKLAYYAAVLAQHG